MVQQIDGKLLFANGFEKLLYEGIPDADKRMHVIDVTDTAYLVMKWFDEYGVQAKAADIVAMTKLILDKERRPDD
jgi:hypothetical protein